MKKFLNAFASSVVGLVTGVAALAATLVSLPFSAISSIVQGATGATESDKNLSGALIKVLNVPAEIAEKTSNLHDYIQGLFGGESVDMLSFD